MQHKTNIMITKHPVLEEDSVEENKGFPPMIRVYSPDEKIPMIQVYPKQELPPMIKKLTEGDIILDTAEPQETKTDLNGEKQEIVTDEVEIPCFSKFVSCNDIDKQRILDPFPANDIGRAERILSSINMELVYNGDEEQLRRWINGHWSVLSEREFHKRIIEALKLYFVLSQSSDSKNDAVKSGMFYTIKSIGETIKSMLNRKGDEFNKADRCVCVKNGVYDFNRKGLFTHVSYKNAYITYRLDVDYIPGYKDIVFDNFLMSIMGDKENCLFLQKVFGYAFIGNPIEQHCYFLQGDGANGKSTLIEAIQNVVGPLATTMKVEYFVSSSMTNPNAPSPATYQFKDKLFAFSSEVPAGAVLNDAVLKKHIGGGNLIGRKLYGNLVEFENKSVLFFDANHLPHFRDGGYAMERRITVIPFPMKFDVNNIDLYMSEKLASDSCKKAILAWLIEGALLYMQEGLTPTTRVEYATSDYFSGENTIKAFFKDAVMDDYKSKISVNNLYEAYLYYCNQNLLPAKSKDVFSKSTEINKYPAGRNNILGRHRIGLRLHADYANYIADQRKENNYGRENSTYDDCKTNC